LVNVDYVLSALFDGSSGTFMAWLNGVTPTAAQGGATNLPTTGTSIPTASNFYVGTVESTLTTITTARPLKTKALRIVSVPVGKAVKNPAWLDACFNRNNFVIFNDYDIVGDV
jgi:hypothetical protein